MSKDDVRKLALSQEFRDLPITEAIETYHGIIFVDGSGIINIMLNPLAED